jgi:alkanesulfonate monooxygenase SsuD/methylene tetrahydromethanopterin reductase-like flavin-dependent oxidoreductase (luciferase family)
VPSSQTPVSHSCGHGHGAYFGAELVDGVARHPSRIDADDDAGVPEVDLGAIVRLARTAERGGMDYLIIDDTLAGNPPFSGRRRDAMEALRLATRLAPNAQRLRLAPRVHASWVEPAPLLQGLVGLRLSSAGPTAWQLDMADHSPPQAQGPEVLAAIVQDVWATGEPKTRLAALARAQCHRRLREGTSVRRPADEADDAGPLLLVRACGEPSARVGANHADVVRIDAEDMDGASARRAAILARAEQAGRQPAEISVIVDVTVCLNSVDAHAAERADLIEAMTDERLGGEGARFIGTPEGLADMLGDWLAAEACDGFTFLPASLPIDLVLIVDRVIPELRRREADRGAGGDTTRRCRQPEDCRHLHA